jgi:phosphoenolpyruvate carboxykinase (ATP)
MRKFKADAWLVNTGWSGGAYGTGERMSLKYTRAIIDAVNDGTLVDAPTETDPVFGLEIPTKCPNVPDEILVPKNTWSDQGAFEKTAAKLAQLFADNFQKYTDHASEEIQAAGPNLPAAV